MDLFRSEKLNDHIIKISDVSDVCAYLVIGDTKAALLDTCCGYGNIKDYVEKLTDKELLVLGTHGHVDHMGGAGVFEKVHLNENDYEVIKEHSQIEIRKGYVDGNTHETSDISKYVIPKEDGYLPLVDGDVFDLGNVHIQCIALPGHTQGMMCMLLVEDRILLLGDGANSFTFLFFKDTCSSVEEYQKNLQNLWDNHHEEFDSVIFSHGHNTGTPQIILDLIDLCQEILEGKDDAVPLTIMNQEVYLGKRIDKTFTREDHKQGNIVYCKDLIK